MGNPLLGRWFGLYTKQTRAERALEPAIAALGRVYRFNHPIVHLPGGWIFPDFVLLHDRVIIEVDGSSHDSDDARRKDEERTARLRADNWVVVRCRNEDVLQNPWAVCNRLMLQAGLPYRVEAPPGWVPERVEAPVQKRARASGRTPGRKRPG